MFVGNNLKHIIILTFSLQGIQMGPMSKDPEKIWGIPLLPRSDPFGKRGQIETTFRGSIRGVLMGVD